MSYKDFVFSTVTRRDEKYSKVRFGELKQALPVAIFLLILGHILAHFTNPSAAEPGRFVAYRILSVLLFVAVYFVVRKRERLGSVLTILVYTVIYVGFALPFLLGAYVHYLYLVGLAQVCVILSIFFPINWLLYTIESVILTWFVSTDIKSALEVLYSQDVVISVVGGFQVFILISILMNYYINRFRRNDFLQKQQLQEVDRLKSDFFSNVSHELRTPLTMLISPLESTISNVKEKLGPMTQRYVKVAHENALYLLELINKLLDFAKIDAGRMTVHLGKGDIDELVRGVTSRFTEYGKKHNIAISVESKGPQQGYFDHEMTKRIVNNLLSNAVKFMKEGGRIDVRVSEDSTSHIIEVEDTGPGIKPEDRDAIFDRFTQKSKSGRAQGTGIGLALSREYARLHKGDITVESELGKGSSFRVTLQKGLEKEYEVKEVTEVEEAKHIDLLGVTEEDLPEITVPAEEKKDQKVLVVEDHQRLREYLASLFVDYQVKTAGSGAEGLQAFLKHKPDVVISDVMMEKEDSGIELCRQVRQQEGGQEIPFIFLTARADIKVKIAGLEAGGVEYLTKPFNPLELRTRVKNILSFVELNQQYKKLYEELEATKEQLIQSEKMASLGVLVRGIGHEIRNPLVFAKLRMGTLMDYLRAGSEAVKTVFADNKERLEAIEYAHERIQNIVTELQRFSTVSSSEVQRIDVKREFEGVLMLLAHELKRGIKVHQEYKGDVVLYGNTVQVSQLIMNLVQNAIHAIEREGEIWIQTESEGEYFIIKVRDNGAGIPEENLRRIWDTFFTTKAKGTGLGLYIVYNVAKNHHGDVSVTSELGQGTEFTVRLKKQAPTPGVIY